MSEGRIAAAFEALDEDGLEEIVKMGGVEPSELRQYPPSVLAMIAEKSRREMVHWATAGFGDEGPPPGRFEYALSNMVLIFSTYYVEAVELLRHAPKQDVGRALLRPDEWERLSQTSGSVIEDDGSRTPEPYATQRVVAGILESLLVCWVFVLGWRDHRTVESRLGATAALLIRHLALLVWYPQLIDDPDSPVRLITEMHLPRLVDAAADALDDLPSVMGNFGAAALRVGDLTLLARRVPEMAQVYGMSTERAFERQLAMLFTSLGFAVVESIPGRRWVDFLCLANGRAPATIAIEAKSTSHAEYVFRADAQRALIEHVDRVQRTLHGLPPLRLVLIVAPAFSSGAEKRIGQVADQIGIACRGFPLDLLCELRQRHVGHLAFDVFEDVITRSPPVIDQNAVNEMLAAFASEAEELRSLIDREIQAQRPS